jgi:hypothetical protein
MHSLLPRVAANSAHGSSFVALATGGILAALTTTDGSRPISATLAVENRIVYSV